MLRATRKELPCHGAQLRAGAPAKPGSRGACCTRPGLCGVGNSLTQRLLGRGSQPLTSSGQRKQSCEGMKELGLDCSTALPAAPVLTPRKRQGATEPHQDSGQTPNRTVPRAKSNSEVRKRVFYLPQVSTCRRKVTGEARPGTILTDEERLKDRLRRRLRLCLRRLLLQLR